MFASSPTNQHSQWKNFQIFFMSCCWPLLCCFLKGKGVHLTSSLKKWFEPFRAEEAHSRADGNHVLLAAQLVCSAGCCALYLCYSSSQLLQFHKLMNLMQTHIRGLDIHLDLGLTMSSFQQQFIRTDNEPVIVTAKLVNKSAARDKTN